MTTYGHGFTGYSPYSNGYYCILLHYITTLPLRIPFILPGKAQQRTTKTLGTNKKHQIPTTSHLNMKSRTIHYNLQPLLETGDWTKNYDWMNSLPHGTATN